MFQGMFRKRGRPPDPPLQIGGYDNLNQQQGDTQIPGHQLRDAPRQLPLPSVREFEQGTDVQQEQPGFNNAIVELSQSSHQHDVDMLDSYNRRLSQDPQHVICSDQGIQERVLENPRRTAMTSSRNKVVRKHSPPEIRPEGPFGQFRRFQRKSGRF